MYPLLYLTAFNSYSLHYLFVIDQNKMTNLPLNGKIARSCYRLCSVNKSHQCSQIRTLLNWSQLRTHHNHLKFSKRLSALHETPVLSRYWFIIFRLNTCNFHVFNFMKCHVRVIYNLFYTIMNISDKIIQLVQCVKQVVKNV